MFQTLLTNLPRSADDENNSRFDKNVCRNVSWDDTFVCNVTVPQVQHLFLFKLRILQNKLIVLS